MYLRWSTPIIICTQMGMYICTYKSILLYLEQSKSFELSSDNESYTCSVPHVILCSKYDAQSLQNV